jgi:hypothetical protein
MFSLPMMIIHMAMADGRDMDSAAMALFGGKHW